MYLRILRISTVDASCLLAYFVDRPQYTCDRDQQQGMDASALSSRVSRMALYNSLSQPNGTFGLPLYLFGRHKFSAWFICFRI